MNSNEISIYQLNEITILYTILFLFHCQELFFLFLYPNLFSLNLEDFFYGIDFLFKNYFLKLNFVLSMTATERYLFINYLLSFDFQKLYDSLLS